MEYESWVPERDVAQGGQEGVYPFMCLPIGMRLANVVELQMGTIIDPLEKI